MPQWTPTGILLGKTCSKVRTFRDERYLHYFVLCLGTLCDVISSNVCGVVWCNKVPVVWRITAMFNQVIILHFCRPIHTRISDIDTARLI